MRNCHLVLTSTLYCRYGLHQRGQWATLPHLVFSQDVALNQENVMDDLFKRADIGPGQDEASDIVISKESNYSLDNLVKNLKMNTDELGVDRDKIFYNIEVSVERSCAKHRQVEDDKVDEFSELYVRSLSSSNVRVVEKKERASKIKKFLAERRQNKEA
jgi:alpha-galactosidase/6-phospho-beta-glucosidase family protein